MTQVKQPQQNQINVTSSLPSADLVQYRFDQLDMKMISLDEQLKIIISGGISKADVMLIKAESDRRLSIMETNVRNLEANDDRQEGSIRANRRLVGIFVTIFSSIVLVIVSLAPHIRFH